jgi:predicted RNA-binding protein with PUA-like domain
VAPVPNPVTLDDVKKDGKLADMALIRFSRLSVQPVTAAEWKVVCKMGGVKE